MSESPVALILHGFTGTLATVRILSHVCDSRDLPWTMPILRGHGTRPEDLEGVTWRDWAQDAEEALLGATAHGERALVMGLSMGGLVALDIAGRHPDRVCGVVSIAACLELAPRLLALLPLIARIMPYWEGEKRPGRDESHSYPRFPTRTLQSLVDFTRVMPKRLARVQAPILVVQSWADQAVKPRSARAIYDGVSSTDRELARFEGVQHDMLLDPRADEVADRIGAWLDYRLDAWRALGLRTEAVA